MELTVEELFAESIDVLVLRENTASTSLSFIDRIWNLLSRKARQQVRIYLLFVAFAFGICSQGEHWFTRTNFVLFDTASRLLLCQNCFTCTTFEIRVGRLYNLFAIRENSGFSKVCDNSHLVCVWS